MNLQRLRYLTEVADGPSLSAAARRLEISQPVLSRAIRHLERELRVSLVELRGRSLYVRDEALPVVEAARRALEAVERVSQEAMRLRESAITMAATRSHQSLLVPMVPMLRARTGVAVRLLAASGSDDVVRSVRCGEADLGFGELVAVGGDLSATIVGEIGLVFASHRGAKLEDPVDLVRHSPLPLVSVSEPERWGLLMQAITRHGGSVDTVLEVSDRSTMVKAVEAGVGYAIGTRSVLAGNPNLELRAIDPPIRYRIAAIRRRRASAVVDQFVAALASFCCN